MSDNLMTQQEVADYLRVSVAAIRKWRREEKIAFIRLGNNSVRIERSEVERFVSDRRRVCA